MEQQELRRLAEELLGERYTMALATTGPEGLWAASVYFAADLEGARRRLYFFSSPQSRHGQNLAANQQVAAAINEDEHNWREIRGIQLDGRCEPVHGARDYLRGWRVYLSKFPFVRELFRGGRGVEAGMAARLRRTQLYVVRIGQLFYLDNRRGFGNRREVPDLAEPGD